MPPAIFEWYGQEYEHNPKSADWYWAVGIIATALVIAAVLFDNYLVAALIVIAAITISLHAAKHPPTHRFAITEHGLLIDHELYPYENMHSFAMFEHIEGGHPPVLSIKNDSWFSPHLLISLHEVDADELYIHLLERIDEGEHPHSLSDLVASWLGF
jgi:hypothetical protein